MEIDRNSFSKNDVRSLSDRFISNPNNLFFSPTVNSSGSEVAKSRTIRCKVFKLLWVLLLTLIASFFAIKVVNSAEVSSTITVIYTLDESRDVKVKYTTVETNLTENKRIKSETIKIPGKVISAKAYLENENSNNQLLTEIVEEDDYSLVKVYFSNLAFGTGQTIAWTLSYTLKDEILLSGNLKYFYVRGIIRTDEIKSFNVKINYPNSYGKVNYSSTKGYELIKNDTTTEINLGEKDFEKGFVLLIFGDAQYYRFLMNYNVVKGISAKIVIPPNRFNQGVILTEISPLPDSSVYDEDGNYILNYEIKSNDIKKIYLEGYVTVFPNTGDSSKDYSISENLNDYLKEDMYWEVTNDEIVRKVHEVVKDVDSNYTKAEKIYTFVVNTLKYSGSVDIQKRQRLGALGALSNHDDVVCQEFSDLFITMARAAGIPAREVDGYGVDIQKNTDSTVILHSWAEFWDDKLGWVQVDPTWEDSTNGNYFNNLGSDHLVFMVRGVSSTNPVITTTFLSSDDPMDNLKVEPVSKIPVETIYNISGEIENGTLYGGVPSNFGVILSNKGNTVVAVKSIEVFIDKESFNFEKINQIVIPNKIQTIKLPVKNSQLWTVKQVSANVKVVLNEANNKEKLLEFSRLIDIRPSNILLVVFAGGILLLAITLVFVLKIIRRKKQVQPTSIGKMAV